MEKLHKEQLQNKFVFTIMKNYKQTVKYKFYFTMVKHKRK